MNKKGRIDEVWIKRNSQRMNKKGIIHESRRINERETNDLKRKNEWKTRNEWIKSTCQL